MSDNDPIDASKVTSRLLEEAFERFNDAGRRLEDRYAKLLRETEDLRVQLQMKDQEIKKAERLSTLGETAALMAHEVRNPLGAIKLFVSLLKRDVEGNKGSLEMLVEIDKAISTIESVVSNILHFSKDHRVAFAPCNVHAVIHEVSDVFSRGGFGARPCSVSLDLQGNPFVLGNEHSLRRVFQNLLLNACQASKESIGVSIDTCDAGDGQLKIVVRDNGPGISSAIMERLFEPFATDKKEGTGLGLAVVRRIVDQHGGSVSVANNPGAEFTILIPRKQSEN